MFTVTIIDSLPAVRTRIADAIGGCPEFRVLASVAGARELDTVPSADVTVVGLYQADGTPQFALIETLCQTTKVLAVSPSTEWADLVTALRSGSAGCLTTDFAGDELRAAIPAVAHGAMYVGRGFDQEVRYRLLPVTSKIPTKLAPRETETLRWIAKGYTHSQTAVRMGLTQTTIDTYVKRIRAKLEVGNKAELTRMAIALNLDA